MLLMDRLPMLDEFSNKWRDAVNKDGKKSKQIIMFFCFLGKRTVSGTFFELFLFFENLILKDLTEPPITTATGDRGIGIDDCN